MSYTLIMPCAGRSRRYPNMRPKYMLTTPNGDMALKKALHSVPQDQIDRIVIGVAKDHDDKYGVQEALKRAIDLDFEIVVLDYETSGPAETVKVIIEKAGVTGAFCAKDADSFFASPQLPNDESFISLVDLRDAPEMTRVAAKSFSVVNEQGLISQIVEKSVISNYVSSGLYGVSSAELFCQAYDKLAATFKGGELFMSHVIAKLIASGEPVYPHYVTDMIDIGTVHEWTEYRGRHAVMFVDLDGVIFKNQSRFFPPYWSEREDPLDKNVEFLLEKQKNGAQLIFATSRPEEYREKTTARLEELGFEIHALIMGCNHGVRYLINDYRQMSNPFPTAKAVNLQRNTENLHEIFD